jgi:hypothetical protein
LRGRDSGGCLPLEKGALTISLKAFASAKALPHTRLTVIVLRA